MLGLELIYINKGALDICGRIQNSLSFHFYRPKFPFDTCIVAPDPFQKTAAII